ncbi:hypothetical protein ACQY0O_007668 [Thecaphora frezii]
MMRELAGQAHGLYNSSKKPFSAVTDWIDRLCTQKYAEEDLDGIPELVEAINLQTTGPAEASRAIRKKLKYSNVHGQKRALIILRYLVENCNTHFQTTFANDQLVERLKLMSQDELVDASVRRLLMRVLLAWHQQYKDDPSMRLVAGLYAACGGGRKSDAQKKSEAAEAYRKREEEARREAQIRSDRKAAERLQKLEEKEAAKRKKNGTAAKRPAFNFQQEKPQILSALATSQSSATALVNALQHVNREKESVTQNTRVQDYLARVKTERKKIIRYIQLVKDEEFVGSLISANDQIILALQLYDRLAKPVELDSDDDEPRAAISAGETAEQKQAARMEADDAEIEMVRKRIAAARLNAPEGELEKLQDRQRDQIELHKTRVGSIRSFDMGSGANAQSQPGGAVGDLMDLNFDDDAPSGAGSGVASHASRHGGMTASESAGSGFNRGALSDYSDYDESDESDEETHRASASGSGSGAGVGQSTRPDGDSWTNLNDSEEEEWLRATQGHRPRIGPGFSWNEGEEDDDDDEDPFADPFADGNAGAIPRPSNQPRREWAAV